MRRREFIQSTSMGISAVSAVSVLHATADDSFKIGMCDWNVKNEKNEGGSCRPDFIPIAKNAHIKGLQVSVATSPDNVALREHEVRKQYIDLGKKHDVHFHSVAAGSILNSIPLASEPESAVYVIEALEAAKAIGASNVLMAFFGRGDLRYLDHRNNLVLEEESPNVYKLDQRGVDRVINVLRQITPRAEDLGIVLGLENTLNAKQNLEIIDRVESNNLQVYYDLGNSWAYGYDVPAEIRMLGNDRICEIHLKDWDTPMLGSSDGMVNFAECAKACRDINYDKWYVLETSGRTNTFIKDTQTNVAFAKKTFG